MNDLADDEGDRFSTTSLFTGHSARVGFYVPLGFPQRSAALASLRFFMVCLTVPHL